jgi:hypothetical protein
LKARVWILQGSTARAKSGDFADSVPALQDAGAFMEGASNLRQVLDCGDKVKGRSPLSHGAGWAGREKRLRLHCQPNPKR